MANRSISRQFVSTAGRECVGQQGGPVYRYVVGGVASNEVGGP